MSALAESTVTVKVLREALWGEQTRTLEGLGSGFVVDTDEGRAVVTAAHVVYGATEVVVVDVEGRTAVADELLAIDEDADVAVLRVEGLSLSIPAISMGPEPAVGEDVVVVGSPLGLSTTVAFGTVSALRPEAKAIQLAAGVSPGSSGGLVADVRGQAVAVVRTKASAEFGGENIALATPMSFVRKSLKGAKPTPLSSRPDRSKMHDVATHRVLTTRGDVFESYPAAASVLVPSSAQAPHHLCARTDGQDVALAIREVGQDDPQAWRQGNGRACATIFGHQPVVVWVGTKRIGRKVQLTISHQP